MTSQLPATVKEAYEDVRIRLSDPRTRKVLAGTGAVLLFAYGIYRRNLVGMIVSGIGAYAAMRLIQYGRRQLELSGTGYGEDDYIIDAEPTNN